MDLPFTWRGDYVVRAGLALAIRHRPEAWVKAAEVAGAMAIPRTYVPQILATLVRAGLVEARAGRRGGDRLGRDPADISVLEVVEVGEGELRRCVLRGSPCGRRGTCAIHDHWLRAQEALRAELEVTHLAEVVATERQRSC